MLKGSLQTVALPEVLNFLADTGKSGEFHLSGSRGEGRIWFEQGRIAGFEIARAREASEAIFEMLRIDDAEFEFAADVARPTEAYAAGWDDGSVGPALDAAEAKMGEWRDIVAVVPSLSHGLQLKAEAPSEPVTLQPEQWMMVVAVGAGRSVAEVIDARELQEFDGCKAVRILVEASLVEVVEPVATVAEAVEPIIVDEPVVVEEPVVDWSHSIDAVVEPSEEPFVEPEVEADEPVPATDESWTDATESHEEEVTESHLSWAGVNESHDEEVTTETEEPAEFGAYPFGSNELEPQTESAESDHYAALRAAMVEIGDDLATDEPEASYVEPEHQVYEFQADPEVDGRAALQALLSEVTEESGVPSGSAYYEPVDGLADRGPWTEHELSTMDGAKESWAAVDGDGASNIVPFAPVHAEDGMVASASEEGSPDEAEEAAATEEPINRGLLLKFLSSVRN